MDQLNNSVNRGAAGGDVNMRARGEEPGGEGRAGEVQWRGEGVAGDVTRRPAQSVITRRTDRSRRRVAFLTPKYDKVAKIFDRQYHSPSKVLKLEDDPWGSCAMYSPDKMKSGGGLMAPPGCFPGRYSPTYRSSDPRRCVPNPSVSIPFYLL